MLGFLPGRVSHYKLAFKHKSASTSQENGDLINNERLEYLGDAILDAIVADYLFRKFPGNDEGFMTKMRARIVKRKNLNFLAAKIGIPQMVTIQASAGNKAKHLYGNALEALMGAIYLDHGFQTAQRFFIRKILQKHINLIQLAKKDSDYKSRIIEWTQKNRIEVVFKSKVEHAADGVLPSFISTISLNGKQKGTGRGGSKKEAEQRAAKEALASIEIQ